MHVHVYVLAEVKFGWFCVCNIKQLLGTKQQPNGEGLKDATIFNANT